MQISMLKCKKRLLTLWLFGGGGLCFLVIIQTILGHYAEASEVWNWLLPNVMPTLSLIISVWIMDFSSEDEDTIDSFVFWVTFVLSGSYLIMVALPILLQPFTPVTVTPLETIKQSNLWLGPFQGLVSASIGAFFVRGKRKAKNNIQK